MIKECERCTAEFWAYERQILMCRDCITELEEGLIPEEKDNGC